MFVKLLEPLNVSDERIEELAKPIKQAGHEFTYYKEKTTDPDELVERSKGADIIMIANTPYPAAAIDENDSLKYINVAFTGIDHVDINNAKKQDVPISNAAGYANDAVAELAIGLTLDVYRGITQGNEDIRKEAFPGKLQGNEIKGKTVGLIGTGKIGLQTARLFHAFGANLVASNQSTPKPEAEAMGVQYIDEEQLMRESDIISLHVPLTDQTRGLISREKIDAMKESAILINCARGPIVDNDALADALNAGKIAGAGIDVFDTEPPISQDDKLLHAKNAILTPHVGFLTDEAMVSRAEISFDNVMSFLNGEAQNVLWPKE